MLSWLRHILICFIALAGCFASERAEAAFLPPQLDASMSGPEKRATRHVKHLGRNAMTPLSPHRRA